MGQRKQNEKRTTGRSLSRFVQVGTSLQDAFGQAARGLRPVLEREGARDVDQRTVIFSRVGKGVVAHAPVRLGRPIQLRELLAKPHAVGVLMATQPLQERVTQAVLEPGTYVVKLRPVCPGKMAFDWIGADGKRAIATPTDARPSTIELRIRIRVLGFDIDINELDDIINPFNDVICISFLHWRVCFDFPRRP
jgi:hypothetical protein